METLLAITMGVDWGSWPPIITRSFQHCSSVNGNWENWFANWFWFEPQMKSELRSRLDTWLAKAFLGLDFMSDLVELVHSGTRKPQWLHWPLFTFLVVLCTRICPCILGPCCKSIDSTKGPLPCPSPIALSFFLNQQGIDYIKRWNWIHKQDLPLDLRKSLSPWEAA